MVDFPLAVNAPGGVSYAAPLIDFSPLSQLGDRFYEGAKNRSQLAAMQTFKDGLPLTPSGEVDYAKAAQMLAASGNLPAISTFTRLATESPQGQAAARRATLAVEQEFKPKTQDITIPGAFGDKKMTVEPIPGQPGKWRPVQVEGMVPGGGGMTASGDAGGEGLTGEEFLNAGGFNSAEKALIRKIANLEILPDKVASLRGDQRLKVLQAVSQYDPNYDAALAPARFAAIKEFNAGGQTSPASTITAGNTAIQHLGTLVNASKKIGGTGSYGPLNSLINKGNVAYRGASNDPDLVEYNNALGRFVEEATKFYRGIGGNEADIQRAIADITAAQSPEARARAIATQAELMYGKINALQDRWRQATGPTGFTKITKDFPIVQPKSQKALNAIYKEAGIKHEGEGSAMPGGGGTAPETTASTKPAATDALAQARAAIAKGADRNAVIQRLKANGIDPTGL